MAGRPGAGARWWHRQRTQHASLRTDAKSTQNASSQFRFTAGQYSTGSRDTMMAVPSTTKPVSKPSKPLVAMVGGGQLARMTHQAAIALGQTLRVLATASDESAAQVSPDVVIGSHTELEDLRRVAAGA